MNSTSLLKTIMLAGYTYVFLVILSLLLDIFLRIPAWWLLDSLAEIVSFGTMDIASAARGCLIVAVLSNVLLLITMKRSGQKIPKILVIVPVIVVLCFVVSEWLFYALVASLM